MICDGLAIGGMDGGLFTTAPARERTQHQGCSRIVRTVQGPGTASGDIYITADGSAWRRRDEFGYAIDTTVGRRRGWLRNGHVCDHP